MHSNIIKIAEYRARKRQEHIDSAERLRVMSRMEWRCNCGNHTFYVVKMDDRLNIECVSCGKSQLSGS